MLLCAFPPGNLVSPSWWTDLWLNEGFASYFGYLASDAVFPTYNMMHFFLLDYLHDALRLDSLESSHPVSIPVKHPDEIGEIFDKISYGKGGSLARMMEHFLTTATYKKVCTLHNTHYYFDLPGSLKLPHGSLLPSSQPGRLVEAPD